MLIDADLNWIQYVKHLWKRVLRWLEKFKNTGINNRLWSTVGEGEGGITWENSISLYIALRKINSQWEFSMTQETQSWCSVTTYWLKSGMGRVAQKGGQIHVDAWQKQWQYCKYYPLIKKTTGEI